MEEETQMALRIICAIVVAMWMQWIQNRVGKLEQQRFQRTAIIG